jgi:hypothetical protein
MDMPMSGEGGFNSTDNSNPNSNIDNTKGLSQYPPGYAGLPISSGVWVNWNHNSELLNIAPSISPHATQLKVESPAPPGMMSAPQKGVSTNPMTGSPDMIMDSSIDFQDDIEEPLFPDPLHNGLPGYNEHSWASAEDMSRNSSSGTSQSQQPPQQQFYYGGPMSQDELSLRTINMPPAQPSSTLSSSPEESLLAMTASPRTARPTTRKRKTSPVTEEEDEAESPESAPPPVKKTAHNMIEKRYRTNLNDKIAALKESVPSLRATEKSLNGKGAKGAEIMEDLDGLIPPNKLNKVCSPSSPIRGIGSLTQIVGHNPC